MAKGGSARTREMPGVDERLVMPESGVEILDGEVLIVPGANPPHATRHADLAYVLRAHTAPGFVAALDMLTRTSVVSDFAPDASVYPDGPDPDTGGRRLENLAFEIVWKQSLSVPTKKARELSRRGVRRVFALLVAKARVMEWDKRLGRWRPMHRDELIVDACLEPSLPVRALLESTAGDEAVLGALGARRPDLVARLEAKAEARGEARGLAAARVSVRALCAALGIVLTDERDRAIESATADELEALASALATARAWPA